jgi:cytochrome c oxidase subunit 2
LNEIVESVDNTFLFIMAVSVVMLLGITATMVLFVLKYSRKKHPHAKQIGGHVGLEVTWTVIPLIMVLVMFYYGYEGFRLMRNVPEDALEVKVTARMWDWSFEYANGTRTDKLYVPLDRPVKLLLKSLDVLHSFYLPAFRVKEDVVPGRETYLWFKPQTTGPAEIFCAEYCGQRHAYMMSQVIVMEPEQFEKWYQSKGDPGNLSEEAAMVSLFEEHDCLSCHSFDADPQGSISLRGILGRATTVVVEGQERQLIADEAYIKRSILEPEAELLKGHEADMPEPENLSEEDLRKMVWYLKNLK